MIHDIKSLYLINQQRKFLKANHPDIFNKGLELEALYGHYNFMVLDLPVFKFDDMDKFHSIWNDLHGLCSRQRTDIANPYQVDDTPRFRSLDIIENMPDRERIWTRNYHNLNHEFPIFYQMMNDLLPFSSIDYVRLWQSIGEVRMHRDDSWWYFNFPTELRIMIYDDNETGTLKIRPEMVPFDVKPVNLPETSNSFSWNNVRCVHGSNKTEGKEKLLACITGTYDLNKLETLFINSKNKYDDISSKTIDDPYTCMLLR